MHQDQWRLFGVITNDEFKNDREIVEQALDNLSEEVLKWDSVAISVMN